MSEHARRELLADLSYLNMAEIRRFCSRHGIPHRILVETPNGERRATVDTDRKPIVLERVRRYLTTSEVAPATCLTSHIVRDDPPPRELQPTDRLYYRWYAKTYPWTIEAITALTNGRFHNGALARVLIMEFRTSGRAPTLLKYADAWVAATDARRDLVLPEYAFLTDLKRGHAGPEWTTLRRGKAQRVISKLDALSPPSRPP